MQLFTILTSILWGDKIMVSEVSAYSEKFILLKHSSELLFLFAVMGCGTSAPDLITSSSTKSGCIGNTFCPRTPSRRQQCWVLSHYLLVFSLLNVVFFVVLS